MPNVKTCSAILGDVDGRPAADLARQAIDVLRAPILCDGIPVTLTTRSG